MGVKCPLANDHGSLQVLRSDGDAASLREEESNVMGAPLEALQAPFGELPC